MSDEIVSQLPWGTEATPPHASVAEALATRMNAPCWCGSRKKFKKCHWNRERCTPWPLHEVDAVHRSMQEAGDCHAVNDGVRCTESAIRSHLVGKSATLQPIAEDGHVYAIPNSLQQEATWELRGRNEASVFPGFCAEHDRGLFAPVDNPRGLFDRHAALLTCYRTLTKELWVKEQSCAFTIWQKAILDRGRQVAEQVVIQNHLNRQAHYHALSVADLSPRKRRLESLLSSADTATGFEWRATDLGVLLPVVGCGAFCCAADFLGRKCTWHFGDGHTSPDTAVLVHAVIPWRGQTSVVFGWLTEDTFAPACHQVAASFASLGLDAQRRAIVHFLFEVTENLFMRPSWWESLPISTKEHLEKRSREGGTNDGHRVDCLVDRGHNLCL